METVQGRVHNGVVVLEDGPVLPDGIAVTVSFDMAAILTPPNERKRVEFPLVRSTHPGSLHLTAERIGEIMEEEDVSP